MEKEFVPYALAVKLKALGFDKPCFVYYRASNENKLAYPNHGVTQNSLCSNGITAPTFSQAFRWFREKYGVHSSPRKYDETQWWVEWGTWTSSIGTFEEAEIAWLTKLIEIVENKSE
jgi:hypothetical protein